MLARVRRTLRERALVAPGMRVLCACSGGPDSAAMLVALSRLSSEFDLQIEVASVDHGLRPDAAADVEAARAQAYAQGVPFHALAVRVETGGSLQAAARAARYAALRELSAKREAQRIATGHTLDDQAETVMMRLLRGAGLAGSAGIAPLRADGVMRPLIDCHRTETHAFARAHCEHVAEDPSNLADRFERVRMREQVLPLLARENPAVAQHLAQLADDARSAVELFHRLADERLPAFNFGAETDETIDLSSLAQAPSPILRAGLANVCEARTGARPGRAQLTQLQRTLRAGTGEVWLAGDWCAVGAGPGRLALRRRRARPGC